MTIADESMLHIKNQPRHRGPSRRRFSRSTVQDEKLLLAASSWTEILSVCRHRARRSCQYVVIVDGDPLNMSSPWKEFLSVCRDRGRSSCQYVFIVEGDSLSLSSSGKEYVEGRAVNHVIVEG